MTEVLKDATTGLPELPEGYFWRVGKVTTEQMRWDGRQITQTIEGVGLIRKTTKTTKTEHPVYGENWYNAWKKVGTRFEETVEVTEKTVDYETFDTTYQLSEKDEVPAYARNVRDHTYSDELICREHEITIDEAGISFLADKIFTYWSERETERLNKARLFGDYPPKTLVAP